MICKICKKELLNYHSLAVHLTNQHKLDNMKKNKESLEHYKYKCMLENNVKIIIDCSKYIDYVKQQYGKNYIKTFKVG